MATSDVLSQTLERRYVLRKRPWDSSRTFQVAMTGGLLSGPLSHVWYNLLNRVGTAETVQSRVRRLPASLALDALVFSPIAVAGYLLFRTFLAMQDCKDSCDIASLSKSPAVQPYDNVMTRLQPLWWSTLQASWSFWPVANVINFTLVPLPYRVLYNNALSLFWNGYLSHSFAVSSVNQVSGQSI